jgi:hypothetical protein
VSSTLALELIWQRMSRPFNLVQAVPALTGIHPGEVADLVTLHLAISEEADALLETVPKMTRNLASTTSSELERCIGNMRGPVMWAETLTARANTFGADDVFVCAAPKRDHNTSENRTLISALELIARANRAINSTSAEIFDAEGQARIVANATAARRLLRSRELAGIRSARVNNREVHKVASGRRSRQYATALDMLQRRAEPLRGGELHALCDAQTIGQHHALVLVMASLQRRGLAVPQFRCESGELVAGRLRYRNWHNATESGNHGVLLDQVLVDSPADASPEAHGQALASLEARAGARQFCLVATPADAEIAVDLALEGTQWDTRAHQPA